MALIERERTHDLPAPSSRHEEKAIAFFGTWALIGLYLDGWAHIHDKPETFFSPWHGVLYSGVGAAVVYFAFRTYVLRKPADVSDRWVGIGFAIFGAGAVGDFGWHEVFGIEVDLEALLSPTHLMLLTGGLLMLTFPARAASARDTGRAITLRRFWPVVASLSLSAMLVQFFTQYFAAHRFTGLWPSAPGETDIWEVAALGAVFVTNAILLGVTFVAVRRWDTPLGTFAVVYGTLALGVTGMNEFVAVLHVPAAVAAGFGADLLARRLRPSGDRRAHALAFACLVPLVVWSAWLVAIQGTDGVRWPVDLWAGTVVLAVLQGLGLGILAFPRPRAARPLPVAEPL